MLAKLSVLAGNHHLTMGFDLGSPESRDRTPGPPPIRRCSLLIAPIRSAARWFDPALCALCHCHIHPVQQHLLFYSQRRGIPSADLFPRNLARLDSATVDKAGSQTPLPSISACRLVHGPRVFCSYLFSVCPPQRRRLGVPLVQGELRFGGHLGVSTPPPR